MGEGLAVLFFFFLVVKYYIPICSTIVVSMKPSKCKEKNKEDIDLFMNM